MSPKVYYGHGYITLVHCCIIARGNCPWLQTCNVAMAMVMVGYTFVFMQRLVELCVMSKAVRQNISLSC